MKPNAAFIVSLCIVATCSDSFLPNVSADDSDVQQQRMVIDRGLNFLQVDAVKWREEHKCSTCHHGTMTIWVQMEAKSRGIAVAEDVMKENVVWAKERILERTDLPRDTRPGWSMVNTPSIYLAIMAHAVPEQTAISADDLKRVSGHLLRHQEVNGDWMWSSAPPKNTPPPFFESDEVATRMVYLALAPQAASATEDPQSIPASLSRADVWLREQTPSETTQAHVLRLVMKLQGKAPADEVQSGIDGLLGLQNSDGGWAQVKERTSDAYATGQVLYALRLADVSPDTESIRKAVAFLVSTQREDGSWPMTKRTHPGETPTQNVIPITYFGSAWATLGLMRCLPGERVSAP